MTYYKIIDGVRYDRSLLDAADAHTQGRGEFRISLEEMQDLYQKALDGGSITEIEQRTLQYIAQHYPLTDKAKDWLLEQLPADNDTEQITQRVLRQVHGLQNMSWQISSATVEQYGAGRRDWEAVLEGAMEAFLHGSIGALSFSACIARRDGMYQENSDHVPLLKSYLDRSTLFLIPPDAADATDLPYDLPPVLDPSLFWTFVLQTPDFEPVAFFAFVHRDQPLQFNKGHFSRKTALDQLIFAAIRPLGRFNRMKWNIPMEEVQRQMALLPGQNFGNALFSAVNAGIFNQESSTSFGDFIRQEIWPDPGTGIGEEMRAYADTGTLHLIPLDYRAQTEGGTAAFPVPPQFSFEMESQWIFGLEMPRKTQVRLLLNTPRDGNDGDTAWNDGFIDDPLPAEERLKKIVAEEFDVDGLQLIISLSEYEVQRQQFGPDWRQLPGLLRQALHTVLHDYLTPFSVFNIAAEVHVADVDPTYFDDPKEYRAAIRQLLKNYLTSATLELLPIELPDNNPVNGEPVEENWLFFVLLPALSDHGFWVVIPRWPDDEQRPFVYGVN